MSKESPEKPIAVFGAITANLIIVIVKFIVAFLTGSSAMLSEGIHSTADTGNGLLLLLGLHQSQKPPDKTHPFGHGQELYFWSLIVAIILFGSGGGISIYEGITRLSHQSELKDPIWNYIVLGVAFLMDGTSWTIALRQLVQRKDPEDSIWHAVRASKDPSIFVVIGEDTADLAGLITAFLGIFLGQWLHSPYPDAIASIIIGCIVSVVAIFLAYESRSLLIGETANPKITRGIHDIVSKNPSVENIRRSLTMHFGPSMILLNLDVESQSERDSVSLVEDIEKLKAQIHEEYPEVKQIFIEVGKLSNTQNSAQPIEHSGEEKF